MKKKSKADRGLFRPRGSPHWWIRYADRNGRIIRESSGATVKKLAREILAKKKVLVAENRHLDVKKVPKTTFFQLCSQWWQLWGQHKRMKGLSDMVKIWKNEIGDAPVREISQQTIEHFLTRYSKRDGVKPASRNRHLTMLRALFNKGLEWGLVSENPALKIKRLRENGARTRLLEPQEVETFLNACGDDLRPIVVTALHTGMRRGEIFGLQWKDVDLRSRVIMVQESKSGRRRAIPIDETLAETLKRLPSRFKKGLVFPSTVREGQRRMGFARQFRTALTKSELTQFRFHDRHTFASTLVMNGAGIKTVQELLGHSDLTMTMRYSHLAPDHRTRAVKLLDRAYQTDTKSDTVKKQGTDQSR